MKRQRNCLVLVLIIFLCSSSTAFSKSSETKTVTNQASHEKSYNSEGKVDPFSNLFMEKTTKPTPIEEYINECPNGVLLESFNFNQLKLIGIILTGSGNRGLLQIPSGKGYVVIKGQCVGCNGGKIIEILKDRIVIEEKLMNEAKKVTVKQREIILYKPK